MIYYATSTDSRHTEPDFAREVMTIFRTERMKKYVAMCDEMSQKEIARAIGLTPAAFNMKLNGKREFKGEEMRKLITLLQIPPAEAGELLFS